MISLGCKGCWYFGRLRTGDLLCNKTGELLSYLQYRNGCDERIETPLPPNNAKPDPLQSLADRLGITVEELRKYINEEKEKAS